MRIAFVTQHDASDVHAYSGSVHYMSKGLMAAGLELEYVDKLRRPFGALVMAAAKRMLYRRLLSKGYQSQREPWIARSYAKQVADALRLSDAGAVISPSIIPLAYLDTRRPVFFWTDAAFAGMVGFYPDFEKLCEETYRHGNELEQEALSRCRLAIYSSAWAARTALDHYHVEPSKVKVVPYGANLDCPREADTVEGMVRGRPDDKCRLLFIGGDWHRKGGDIALQVAERLNNMGLRTELAVVGCSPPGEMPHFAVKHGFVSKVTAEGRKLLDGLFAESHFLILPTRADCCPVVLAEACSFGLPVLTTDVGGVSTAVRNGINGWAFALRDGAEQYSDYVLKTMHCKDSYIQLGMSSFNEYKTRLNWLSAGRAVRALIAEHGN